MLKIGLTGGIGSGKSSVCSLFAEYGVPIVDADVIARQLVEPGQPALETIVDTLGRWLLNADGSLNRVELRGRVFGDRQLKQQLEAILHPLIYARIAAVLAELDAIYAIVAIPLLVETGKMEIVDRVLLVDCPRDIQIQRVVARDKINQSQAAAIIAAQADRQQRLNYADDVIDNSGAPGLLAEQVKSLHNSYLLLAKDRTSPA